MLNTFTCVWTWDLAIVCVSFSSACHFIYLHTKTPNILLCLLIQNKLFQSILCVNVIAEKFSTGSCWGMWSNFDNYQVLVSWVSNFVNIVFTSSMTWINYLSVLFCSPDTVYSANAGESERTLREAFSEASSHTALGKSSVIFIDQIDTLCPPRNSKYGTIHDFYAE
jgi:hypothetical protein